MAKGWKNLEDLSDVELQDLKNPSEFGYPASREPSSGTTYQAPKPQKAKANKRYTPTAEIVEDKTIPRLPGEPAIYGKVEKKAPIKGIIEHGKSAASSAPAKAAAARASMGSKAAHGRTILKDMKTSHSIAAGFAIGGVGIAAGAMAINHHHQRMQGG